MVVAPTSSALLEGLGSIVLRLILKAVSGLASIASKPAIQVIAIVIGLLFLYDNWTKRIPSRREASQAPEAQFGLVGAKLHSSGASEHELTSDGIDIVFVHGLAANPDTTWRAKCHDCPSKPLKTCRSDGEVHWVYWVTDFLYEDLIEKGHKDIRIYFYNYDSYWAKDAVPDRLQIEAIGLKEGLRKVRKSDVERDRKIVFVAHCYGGLVVKKMLCLPDAKDAKILESSKAAIFLGTPHRGSKWTGVARMHALLLQGVNSNPKIFSPLDYDSVDLSDLDSDFLLATGNNLLEINCFEMRPVPYFKLWFYQIEVFIVTEPSAAPARAKTRPVPLSADHFRLNKFARQDKGVYPTVRDEILKAIEHAKETDEITELNNGQIAKLPYVFDATAESEFVDGQPKCHGETRREIRSTINTWAANTRGKSILWLSGRAGTGKSTIARTIAAEFLQAQPRGLGASFFFSRKKTELSSASKLFPTLAHQLAMFTPALGRVIGKAIQLNPYMIEPGYAMLNQWNLLIRKPLECMPDKKKLILVIIDALDNCMSENDVEKILKELTKESLQSLPLRLLITSRSEAYIRDILKGEVASLHVENFDLDDMVQSSHVKRDISEFILHELGTLHGSRLGIKSNGLCEADIKTLTQRANGLFIYAKVACSYIKGSRQDTTTSAERLSQVLGLEKGAFGDLDKMYTQIILQAVGQNPDSSLGEQFMMLLGLLVTLSQPVTVKALGRLCAIQLEPETVYLRLEALQSFLVIPDVAENADVVEPLINIYHDSLRDFLLRGRSSIPRFRIDEKLGHRDLFISTLRIMWPEEDNCLKKDICDIHHPATLTSEVERSKLEYCLPVYTRYACQYWVDHLEKLEKSQQEEVGLCDNGKVHKFLLKHFLHWLEALSLIGRISEAVRAMQLLKDMVDGDKNPILHDFIHDASRFLLYNRSIIEKAPLQTYYAALLFSPEQSIVRNSFKSHISHSMRQLSKPDLVWNSELQLLETDEEEPFIAFAPDSPYLATSAEGGTIQLWHTTSGVCFQKLNSDMESVTCLAFSPDGKVLVSGSLHSDTMSFWDTRSWVVSQKVPYSSSDERTGHVVRSIFAFSPVGVLVAGFSKQIGLRMKTFLGFYQQSGEHIQTHLLQDDRVNRPDRVKSLHISPDGQHLLIGLLKRLKPIRFELWDMHTKHRLREFHNVEHMAFICDNRLADLSPGHNGERLLIRDLEGVVLGEIRLKTITQPINSFAIASNSLIAVRGNSHLMHIEQKIQIWTIDGQLLQSFAVSMTGLGLFDSRSLKFSPDGRLLAVGDQGVRLIDVAHRFPDLSGTAEVLKVTVTAIDLYSDQNTSMLASGNRWGSITLWKHSKNEDYRSCVYLPKQDHLIYDLGFSMDGVYITSLLGNGCAILWDVASCRRVLTLSHGTSNKKYQTTLVKLSYDCKYMVTGEKNGTMWLWSVELRHLLHALQRPPSDDLPETEELLAVEFSWDSQRLFSSHRDGLIVVWETASGNFLHHIQGDSRGHTSLAVSRDDTKLAAGSKIHGNVLLWDIQSPEYELLDKWTDVDITKNLDEQGLAFSPQGGFLYSGPEILLLKPKLPESPLLPCKLLWDKDSWVTRQDGSRILWLPRKYRPSKVFKCYLFKSSHNTVAIGCGNSSVMGIEIGCECSDPVERTL